MSRPPFTSAYERTLIAMEYVLRRIGDGWADWMKTDLDAWRENRDVSHHLGAYGGMGSFNDVIICRMNHHEVTDEQEPWANWLFKWLKAMLLYFARHPLESPSSKQLRRAIGVHAPSLAAYVGGERAPDSMRGFLSDRIEIQGAACLSCGDAAMTPIDLDWAIAGRIVPEMLFDASARATLVQAIDAILSLNVPGLGDPRARITAAALAGTIPIRGKHDWFGLCVRCGSKGLAAYHWVRNASTGAQTTAMAQQCGCCRRLASVCDTARAIDRQVTSSTVFSPRMHSKGRKTRKKKRGRS